MVARHPRPHVAIPPGAAPPTNPSPSASFSSLTPEDDPLNLWTGDASSTYYEPSTSSNQPRISLDAGSRPVSRPASAYEEASPGRLSFPQPHIFRSSSQRASARPSPTVAHRSIKSETTLSPYSLGGYSQGESRPPSTFESSPELIPKDLSEELSNLSLESEEGLRRFQADDLAENDEQWHRLVPPEAREVLDKKEVQRQSVLFEIIKSEKDYVSDLELIREVYIEPMINVQAVPEQRIRGFISEVFYNLDRILAHHQRLLAALFARQRDQHPLVQSLADIILHECVQSPFQRDYEDYIKHYPLAEERHRAELKRNTKYQYFLQQCAQGPRVRKRDLITFLSRPVTRLARLRLLVENALKATAPDHPDIEELPLIIEVLGNLIKSTQPGIQAAEGKVKFWNLCESLVYQKGEIIDMDLYDESRTLIYQGPLARRFKSEVAYSWADLHVALLDNYLLLLKPETRSSGITRNSVVSRPIPLEYLRLAAFDGPMETRKERIEDGSLFESFRSRVRPLYPFTIYHASAKSARRYTLYAGTEELRKEWHSALIDGLGVRKVRQESNMWFAPHTINEGYFKYTVTNNLSSRPFTGRCTAAAPLTSGGKNFVAVGCSTGIYVAPRGEASSGQAFRKVLNASNIVSMAAIPHYNRFIVLYDGGLYSYALDLVARVAQRAARRESLEASMERIDGRDGPVLFFQTGTFGSRTVVVFGTKGLMQAYVHALEVVNISEQPISPRRSTVGSPSFRPIEEPLSVPKDAHDITVLTRSGSQDSESHKGGTDHEHSSRHRDLIGICTEKGIYIADPLHLAAAAVRPNIIPNFLGADQNAPLDTLRKKCIDATPLGLVRCLDGWLVVYDELGCYIDRKGVPTRHSGYLRWETKASAYAHRGEHLILFSPEFIEIRTVQTGKLVQVIEAADVRLLYRGLLPSDKTVLIGMKGKQDRDGVVDKIAELLETAELLTPRAASMPLLWDEWDTMQ
ncbi:hypothetical protein CERSUDRAFT_87363 [Gelatoporia subvermispora B]|uniref:DH domain-containing protein n=1 Tax=Ceriporiopsis subvermispora (strain B) TaxID=914234 RepID=M2R5U9_CERS8|nr:hypothetical protein CERSUDRAFT_87363 [Gelatoporia subvermispora B]